MKETRPQKDRQTPRHQCLCPWWLCFTFDNPLRKLVQDPERVLRPYIKPGWTVLDIGPGMGYFTIAMARLVGRTGKVIAVDIQPHMLEGIDKRARRAGVRDRIQLHVNTPDSLGITEPIDFCLAFWMLHEVPERFRLLSDIASILKENGLLLIAEPKYHVSLKNYRETFDMVKRLGLTHIESPQIFLSYSDLFRK